MSKIDWKQVFASYSKFFWDAFVIASVLFTWTEIILHGHWIFASVIAVALFVAMNRIEVKLR